jgi:hypothetical protein
MPLYNRPRIFNRPSIDHKNNIYEHQNDMILIHKNVGIF